MTDREIDVLIAQKVFNIKLEQHWMTRDTECGNWECLQDYHNKHCRKDCACSLEWCTNDAFHFRLADFSSDMDAAFTVLLQMKSANEPWDLFDIEIRTMKTQDDQWYVTWTGTHGAILKVSDISLPRAICVLALKILDLHERASNASLS